MIIYDLLCGVQQHRIEGGFKHTEDFKRQSSQDLLTHPIWSKHIPSVCKISRRTDTQHANRPHTATPMRIQKRAVRNNRGTASLARAHQRHHAGVMVLALPADKIKLN